MNLSSNASEISHRLALKSELHRELPFGTGHERRGEPYHRALRNTITAVALDPHGHHVWLAVVSNGVKVLCWAKERSENGGGSQLWRTAGVKVLYEHERHRVQTVLVLPASNSVLCWMSNGDVIIFDAVTYTTTHTCSLDGGRAKACIFARVVSLRKGGRADEVALLRFSRSNQRIMVQWLHVDRMQVKRRPAIVAFLSDCDACAGTTTVLGAVWLKNAILVALDTKFVMLSNARNYEIKRSAVGDNEVRFDVVPLWFPISGQPRASTGGISRPEATLDRVVHRLFSKRASVSSAASGRGLGTSGRGPPRAPAPGFAGLLPTREPGEVLLISYPFALLVDENGDVVKGRHPLDLSRRVDALAAENPAAHIRSAAYLGSKLLVDVATAVLVYEWAVANEGDFVGDVQSEELRLVQEIPLLTSRSGAATSVFLAAALYSEVAVIASPFAVDILKPEDLETQALFLLHERRQLSAAWRLAKGAELTCLSKGRPCPAWVHTVCALVLAAFLEEGRWKSAVQVLEGLDARVFHPTQLLYHFWELLPESGLARIHAAAAASFPGQPPELQKRLRGLAETASPVLKALRGAASSQPSRSGSARSVGPSGGPFSEALAERERALSEAAPLLAFLEALLADAAADGAASIAPHTASLFPRLLEILEAAGEVVNVPAGAETTSTIAGGEEDALTCTAVASRLSECACGDLFEAVQLQLLQLSGRGAELEAACRRPRFLGGRGSADGALGAFVARQLQHQGNEHAQALLLCSIGRHGEALGIWQCMDERLRAENSPYDALPNSELSLPQASCPSATPPPRRAQTNGHPPPCPAAQAEAALQQTVVCACAAEVLCDSRLAGEVGAFAERLAWLMSASPHAALAVLLARHDCGTEHDKQRVLQLWPTAETLLAAQARHVTETSGHDNSLPLRSTHGAPHADLGGGSLHGAPSSLSVSRAAAFDEPLLPDSPDGFERLQSGNLADSPVLRSAVAQGKGSAAASDAGLSNHDSQGLSHDRVAIAGVPLWDGSPLESVAAGLWLVVRYQRRRLHSSAVADECGGNSGQVVAQAQPVPDASDVGEHGGSLRRDFMANLLALALAVVVDERSRAGLSPAVHAVYGSQQSVAHLIAPQPAALRLVFALPEKSTALAGLQPLAASAESLRALLRREITELPWRDEDKALHRGLDSGDASALLARFRWHPSSEGPPAGGPTLLPRERAQLLELLDTDAAHKQALHVLAIGMHDVPAATAYLHRVLDRLGSACDSEAAKARHTALSHSFWEHLQTTVLRGSLAGGVPARVAVHRTCAVQRAAGSQMLTGASFVDALLSEDALGPAATLGDAVDSLKHLLVIKRSECTQRQFEASFRRTHRVLLHGQQRALCAAYLRHSDSGRQFFGPGLLEPVDVPPASGQQTQAPTCAYCKANGRRDNARVFVSPRPHRWLNAADEQPYMIYANRNIMCHECARISGLDIADVR